MNRVPARPGPLWRASIGALLACALGGCAIIDYSEGAWYLPQSERLAPGKATFEDVLDVLGPPDDFCTESGDEEITYPTILRGTFARRPQVDAQGPDGACWLWIYYGERMAHVDFGRLTMIAIFFGVPVHGPPLIFGTDRDHMAFIRAQFSPEGALQAFQASAPPKAFPLTVNPFN